MSYLRLAMVTLIWKQTVAFLLWNGGSRLALQGIVATYCLGVWIACILSPSKLKHGHFSDLFFFPVRVWRPIENGSATHFWVATHQLGTTGLDGVQQTTWATKIIGNLSGENLVWWGETASIPLWKEWLSFLEIWTNLLVIQKHDNPGLRPGSRVVVLHTSLRLPTWCPPPPINKHKRSKSSCAKKN